MITFSDAPFFALRHAVAVAIPALKCIPRSCGVRDRNGNGIAMGHRSGIDGRTTVRVEGNLPDGSRPFRKERIIRNDGVGEKNPRIGTCRIFIPAAEDAVGLFETAGILQKEKRTLRV